MVIPDSAVEVEKKTAFLHLENKSSTDGPSRDPGFLHLIGAMASAFSRAKPTAAISGLHINLASGNK